MEKANANQNSTTTPERLTLKQRIALSKAERKVDNLDLMTKLNQTAAHINENFLFKNSTTNFNETSAELTRLSIKVDSLSTEVVIVKAEIETVKTEVETSSDETAAEVGDALLKLENFELQFTLTNACATVAKSFESNDTRLATCSNQIAPFFEVEDIYNIVPGLNACKSTCDDLKIAVESQKNSVTLYKEGDKEVANASNPTFTKEEIEVLANKGMVVIPETLGWDAKLIVPMDQLSTIGFDNGLIAKIPQNSVVACVNDGYDAVSYSSDTHACICMDDYILGNNSGIYNVSMRMKNYGYSDFTDVGQVCDEPS